MVLGGCASFDAAPSPDMLLVQVVNYQLVAGRLSRLVVAAVTPDNRWIALSEPRLLLAPLDGSTAPLSVVPDENALPGPGGGVVFVAGGLDFAAAGPWRVTLSGRDEHGRTAAGDAAFEVLLASASPLAGDPAPTNGALAARSWGTAGATLVVFTKASGCASRYCQPVVDLVADVAAAHAGEVAYVVVDSSTGQRADLEPWLGDSGNDYHQPWTFLVDPNGRIVASWDVIVTRVELEAAIAALSGAQPSD
jgi:hypothetical protein